MKSNYIYNRYCYQKNNRKDFNQQILCRHIADTMEVMRFFSLTSYGDDALLLTRMFFFIPSERFDRVIEICIGAHKMRACFEIRWNKVEA